jgi:hypothetical protein
MEMKIAPNTRAKPVKILGLRGSLRKMTENAAPKTHSRDSKIDTNTGVRYFCPQD